jgi:membrane-associated phospholipid phosphatase
MQQRRNLSTKNPAQIKVGFYLPRNLLDFVAMSARNVKWNWLLWLLAGVAAIALAWQLDGKVDAALDAAGKPSLQKLAWWFSKIGEGWVVALWGIVCATIFFLMKRPEVAAKIFFVALTSEIAGLVTIIIRTLVGRTRPNASVPQGIYGVWHDGHWIIGKYEFSSFPSGHSAVAVGLATAAWLFNPRWGIVAAIYAVAVMWSRIAQESHHLSDVIGSIVLSIPIAVLMKKHFAPVNEIFFEKLADKKVAGKSLARKF